MTPGPSQFTPTTTPQIRSCSLWVCLYTQCECRQLGFLSEFTTYLRYIKCKDNIPTDALCRLHALKSMSFSQIDSYILSHLQESEAELQECNTAPMSVKLEDIFLETPMLCVIPKLVYSAHLLHLPSEYISLMYCIVFLTPEYGHRRA